MQYQQLGKTDLIVSRICFGCWQQSPKFWGNVDQDAWEKAVIGAPDNGVNFIDTADAYGDGYAETRLGEVLTKHHIRDKYIIATKFYWNFSDEEQRFPDTRHDYILRECEASLERLQTDRIDLYQIHAWDALIRPAEVAEAFARLKREGKVRWFGVSNWNSDQMRMLQKYFPIECLQPHYNLIARDIEARELPFCLENRIGVIAYSPLHRGLLTGKYAPDHQFTDSRAGAKYFSGEPFKRILEALHSLQPIAEKYELTIPQLSIAWLLTQPAVTSTIVGIKTLDHIATIVPAAKVLLEQHDWHHVANVIEKAKSG
jgi:aryl-alcohol dehydrogenase-like predicted oxidoreductase